MNTTAQRAQISAQFMTVITEMTGEACEASFSTEALTVRTEGLLPLTKIIAFLEKTGRRVVGTAEAQGIFFAVFAG
jgi:hypothetical protein